MNPVREALGRRPTAGRIRTAAAEAPAAAAPEPGAGVGTLGVADDRHTGTPEAVVGLVLSELAEVRREVEIDRD